MRSSLKLTQSAQHGKANLKISKKPPKFRSKGHLFGKIRPNGEFKPKHLVESLFTHSTDSHLQHIDRFSSTSANTRNYQYFSKLNFSGAVGEFPKKITPLNSFSTVRAIFTNSVLIDLSQQE
jgi:hypothetical protein